MDSEWYISWAENGKSGNNPHVIILLHFHVIIFYPEVKNATPNALENDLKQSQLGVQLNQNGLSSGIQYCSKEGPPFLRVCATKRRFVHVLPCRQLPGFNSPTVAVKGGLLRTQLAQRVPQDPLPFHRRSAGACRRPSPLHSRSSGPACRACTRTLCIKA